MLHPFTPDLQIDGNRSPPRPPPLTIARQRQA
jgi:hypothetical protein